GPKTLDVESQRASVLDQVVRRLAILVLVEAIVHLPEPALGGGRLRGFGRLNSVRMHVPQGKVAKDRPELVAQGALKLFHDRIGGTAIGAFIVAVLDQGHRRRLGTTADVVIRADRNGQPRAFQLAHAGLGSAMASRAVRIPSAPGLMSGGE